MGDEVTKEQVDAAHMQWRAQIDQVEDFASPNSVRFRQANPKHRAFMLEDFRRHAEDARARYDDLLQRFDRQERLAREAREEELLRRRVEAEEETARQLARQSAIAGRTTQPGESAMNEKLRNIVQKKEADSLRLLKALYEMSDGNEHVLVPQERLYETAGLTLDEGEGAYRYMQSEGLLIGKPGHHISITHRGAVEVANAVRHPDRDTEHFTQPTIHMVNHFQGATIGAVQTGADAVANVQQNIGASSGEIARLFAELRAKTVEIPEAQRADAAELVDDLEIEAKKPVPNVMKVKMLTTGLATFTAYAPIIATIAAMIAGNQ